MYDLALLKMYNSLFNLLLVKVVADTHHLKTYTSSKLVLVVFLHVQNTQKMLKGKMSAVHMLLLNYTVIWRQFLEIILFHEWV